MFFFIFIFLQSVSYVDDVSYTFTPAADNSCSVQVVHRKYTFN